MPEQLEQPSEQYGAPEHDSPLHQEIHDLVGDAQTPEDLKLLQEWMDEADAEREDALKMMGKNTLKETVELPDGTLETKERIDAQRKSGQESSGTYGTQNRRS